MSSAFPGRDAARSAASQSRDRTKHRAWYGPGSAAHRCALRCVRGTDRAGNDARIERTIMRAIPTALQAKLDSGVTTLARCWKVTRRDGVVLGFTDHDRDLVLDGVTFRAGTGFAASEATSRFDLAV